MSHECLKTLRGHTIGVSSVAWSPDGQKIVSSSTDNTIKIWDTDTHVCLGTLSGHLYGVSSVAWSPDGQKIASGSYDNNIKIWDVSKYCEYEYFNKFQFID